MAKEKALNKAGLEVVKEEVGKMIPTSLPANGGNADMLNGKTASDFPVNKVLTTLDEVNDTNLESGIYSAEGVEMTFPTVFSFYFALIVNKHRLNPGFGTQIAIPYDSGNMAGIFYRNAAAGVWNNWKSISGNVDSALIGTVTGCKFNTILDWANAQWGNAFGSITIATGFPSDAPYEQEALLQLQKDFYSARAIITWTAYAANAQPQIRQRLIFNDEWGESEWRVVCE